MQNLLKFSDYDIFAYVIAGLALMIGLDVVLGWETILRRDGSLSLSEGAVRVLIAYVIGMLLTAPSSYFLQRKFEHRVVGQPFGSLMRASATAGWRGIFGSYHNPASEAVRERVKERLLGLPGWDAARITTLETLPNGARVSPEWLKAAEGVFFAAHPAATRDSVAAERMETFLKLYGFCRNLAFVLLICTVGFLALWVCGVGPAQLGASSTPGSGVTVVVVPSDAAAANVQAAAKQSPVTCKPFSPTKDGVAACAPLPSHKWMALGSFVAAILLFWRFLYFHRLYALEVLTAYSREKKPEPAQPQIPQRALLTAIATLVAATAVPVQTPSADDPL